MSAETRATGASILLAVDGLFLGALLFIHASARRGAGPWPDAGGGPGAALPWAAAGAAVGAAILLRLRLPPVAPLFAIAAAIACTLLALGRMGDAGATFGSGRYGTLATVLAVVWVVHLAGAIVAVGRGQGSFRFVALQAIYGIGLAALVFPA